MTPKIVVILDPKKLTAESFRYDEPGRVPPIIDPPEPEEPKDGGLVKDKPGTLNNEKPN
jgi:hypothetical protein